MSVLYLDACVYHVRYSISSHLISYVNETLEHSSSGLEAPTFKQEPKMDIAQRIQKCCPNLKLLVLHGSGFVPRGWSMFRSPLTRLA
jgi:hypothetical protein